MIFFEIRLSFRLKNSSFAYREVIGGFNFLSRGNKKGKRSYHCLYFDNITSLPFLMKVCMLLLSHDLLSSLQRQVYMTAYIIFSDEVIKARMFQLGVHLRYDARQYYLNAFFLTH